MPRQTKPLTNTECRQAKVSEKDIKLFDGGGLYLLIKQTGSKRWYMKYTRPSGKVTVLSFGSYPDVSLVGARAKRDEAKQLLAQQIDPQTKIQADKLENRYATTNTFELVAREWHKKEYASGKWINDHAATILSRLQNDVFPYIGKQPVNQLKTRDFMMPLEKIAKRGSFDLANRVRWYIQATMRYAVQTGRIDYNPSIDLTGATAAPKSRHFPALPLPRLPEMIARIDAYASHMGRHAALFALLTGARSSEFRFSRWEEFDLLKGIWTIPPEREALEKVRHSQRGEKMNRERIIYLTRQTIRLLECIHQINGNSLFVFQGLKLNVPISENTVNNALRRMGYDTQKDVCLHGFRTMITSALNESNRFSVDAIERHIGHEEKSVRGIYNREAKYLKERQVMLQWWADYLDAIREAKAYVEPRDFEGGLKAGGKVINLFHSA